MRIGQLKIALMLALTLGILTAKGQSFIGFWKVQRVSMGERSMTPVGRWIEIASDGSFQGGNGGLVNARGDWEYDAEAKTFFPVDPDAPLDPFGAFRIRWEEENMIWEREEDGGMVVVEWAAITSLPTTPADRVVGLWDLIEAEEEGMDIMEEVDPSDSFHVFIRWDRIFEQRVDQQERVTGYWFMHAHRPELALIYHGSVLQEEKWYVSFSGEQLVLSGNSLSNRGRTLTFQRIREFPE